MADKTSTKALHNLDKRLAVLEAISTHEAGEAAAHRHEMKENLAEIKKSIDLIKIRVAGFSAGISIVAFLVMAALQYVVGK
jgi:hypothetical protein